MWIYCQFQTGMNGESTHGSYMVAGRAHWQYCPITVVERRKHWVVFLFIVGSEHPPACLQHPQPKN